MDAHLAGRRDDSEDIFFVTVAEELAELIRKNEKFFPWKEGKSVVFVITGGF